VIIPPRLEQSSSQRHLGAGLVFRPSRPRFKPPLLGVVLTAKIVYKWVAFFEAMAYDGANTKIIYFYL
ncbi:hypothetical protein WGC32_07505, partial [Zongyangia sp. HA2173]|uniref:hypothetical protein n=1 Tax=Zongyangia sp. HA2173 TaxID=3133035 RepID=UPI00316A66C3